MKTSIVHVIGNALNHVDLRLMNHGRRVAHLTYRLMQRLGVSDPALLRQYALTGLFHDIGAYKTEEVRNMLRFEANQVWEHAIYGYLFIKYFSPVAKAAPAILFHHANLNETTYLDPSLRSLAQSICVADRADFLFLAGHPANETFRQNFYSLRESRFNADILDAFFCEGWEELLEETAGGAAADETFSRLLYGGWEDDALVEAFSKMLVFAIDFRSPQTVTHTITSTCVSEYLGTIVPIDPEEKKRLHRSAMLHDLGKIGIQPAILEKTGKLTEGEMAVMKQHVPLTKTILDGFLDKCSLRLSIRHHEKLDGSGYPYGLTADELTAGQRLVAVADIFSALAGVRSYKEAFPKEKVIAILCEMAEAGQLDRDIVAAAVREYDAIMAAVLEASKPVLEQYRKLNAEYHSLRERVEGFADGRGKGEIRE